MKVITKMVPVTYVEFKDGELIPVDDILAFAESENFCLPKEGFPHMYLIYRDMTEKERTVARAFVSEGLMTQKYEQRKFYFEIFNEEAFFTFTESLRPKEQERKPEPEMDDSEPFA